MNTLITGATAGIGAAIARQIAKDSQPGDTLIATYGHNDEAAQLLVTELGQYPLDTITVKADLSERDNLSQFVEKLSGLVDGFDQVVLNIGVGTYKPFMEYCFEDWDRVIESNLTIPVFLVQKLYNGLLNKNASIIFMGSLAGIIPYSSSLVYGVSKAGLLFAVKALVKEVEPLRVRINGIAPGFIETRWQSGRSQESYNRINAKIAAHRFGEPEEVAQACIALLKNTYINGTILNVDGGYGYF